MKYNTKQRTSTKLLQAAVAYDVAKTTQEEQKISNYKGKTTILIQQFSASAEDAFLAARFT